MTQILSLWTQKCNFEVDGPKWHPPTSWWTPGAFYSYFFIPVQLLWNLDCNQTSFGPIPSYNHGGSLIWNKWSELVFNIPWSQIWWWSEMRCGRHPHKPSQHHQSSLLPRAQLSQAPAFPLHLPNPRDVLLSSDSLSSHQKSDCTFSNGSYDKK